MYSQTFKAFEEKAKAAGLKIQTEVMSDGICRALKLVLTDENGKHTERYEDIAGSITEAHERVFLDALSDYFGEAASNEAENAPEKINEGFVTGEYGTGFLVDGTEDVAEIGITTPEEDETTGQQNHKDAVPANVMVLPTQTAEPEDGEYGADFESTARAFAKESDRHFSALIANQRTRDLIGKLIRMDKINDKAALETKEKGLAYLKVHGIAL